MAADVCKALSSFYSDYCQKVLYISVSSDFYDKYIVTQDYCVYPQILLFFGKL